MDSSTLFMRILGTALFLLSALEAVRGLAGRNRERGLQQAAMPVAAFLLLGLSQPGAPILTPIGFVQLVGWLPAWCAVAVTQIRNARYSGLPDSRPGALSTFFGAFPKETLQLLELVLLAEGMAACAIGALSVGIPGESLTPWLLFALSPIMRVGGAGLLLSGRSRGIEWLSDGRAFPVVVLLVILAVVALPVAKVIAGRNCQLPWVAATAAFLIHAALAASRIEQRCVRPDTPAQRLQLYAPLLLFVPFELIINFIQLDAGTLFLLLAMLIVSLLLIGARSVALSLCTLAALFVALLLWLHIGIRPILRLESFLDARGGLAAQQIASLFSQARGGLFGRGHLFLLSGGPALPLPRTDGLLSGMTEIYGVFYTVTFMGLIVAAVARLVGLGLRRTGFSRAYALLAGALGGYSLAVSALWQAGLVPVVGVAIPCSFGVWNGLLWAWVWGSSSAVIGTSVSSEIIVAHRTYSRRSQWSQWSQRSRRALWAGAVSVISIACCFIFIAHTVWVAAPGRAATLSFAPNDLEMEGMIRRGIESGWLAPNPEDPLHKPAVVLGPAEGAAHHARTIRTRLRNAVSSKLVTAVADGQGQVTLHPALPIRITEPSGLGATTRLAEMPVHQPHEEAGP
jgi:cell division protein FtsW (lipid II flippase)